MQQSVKFHYRAALLQIEVTGLVIETEKLTKIYDKKTGCRDVTISVKKGEIFGFLGPNGAGKSTFTKMLVGLLFPTSGRAEILGKPVGDVQTRAKIGYLPENFRYQDWMTGADLLSFHASLYKLDTRNRKQRIEEVLELVNLKGQENYKIGAYSKGMQQRLGIASALLPDPELLFLDEPTSALDPIGRKEVRDIMFSLKISGKTIFLNSHLLSEVEMLCDSVAFIKKGSIIKHGAIDDILCSKFSLNIHAESINDSIAAGIKMFDRNAIISRNRIQLKINNKADIPKIAEMIMAKGGKLFELTPHRENLEDLFISLISGGENQ
jgi:ABC-2 type transport system ATP-binding protein